MKEAFQLKGSLFTLTVLQLLNANQDAFLEQLATLVQTTPKFFEHAPIVIDLTKVSDADIAVDFAFITSQLRLHGLIPVGIRAGTTAQQAAALAAGLAILPNAKQEPAAKQKVIEPVKSKSSLVIEQPVRSGQQIYAQGSDLIILTSVSPGAELLADGHIHVYGALRGRALAGVMGDQQARIFCQTLEAELVSIAGNYWVNEDLKAHALKQSAHIYLHEGHLRINSLY